MPRPDIDHYEKLAGAATEGPWTTCGAQDGKCCCGLIWNGCGEMTVASVDKDNEAGTWTDEAFQANKAFIASARTAVPELVAWVRELEKVVDALAQDECWSPPLDAADHDEACLSCKAKALSHSDTRAALEGGE